VLSLSVRGEGGAAHVDPSEEEPLAAAPLPLPHVVPADGPRPTGRVRVRLTGRTALVGLRIARR
jgi:hypothetical protein